MEFLFFNWWGDKKPFWVAAEKWLSHCIEIMDSMIFNF
jgi:hypothetical protein